MDYEFGLKELYFVTIKSTYPMRIKGKDIQPGEVIAAFDKILISAFTEDKKFVSAHGGYEDKDRVWWESTKDVRVSFTQGIFSKTQFSLMNNVQLFDHVDEDPIYIPRREILESDEHGVVTLSSVPYNPFFLYDLKTGEKLQYAQTGEKSFTIAYSFTEVVVDYYELYNKGAQLFKIGNTLSDGFFRLEGRTRVKDDITGQTKTGIITIPRLKLVSDLSMRLGREASPVVTQLNGIACPTDEKGIKTIMDILLLSDDVDSDM